ncbi:hypothetical protein [Raineyella sp. W15-4]|uniref:hypothetical protein n=1 Tax=Raineyella sp. W15-4 TaxID=3081651 RepID=UPI0029548D42|nr:hypothetical protein [Raineyella sp. W15-4]WOQ15630.1 hypothetical protein R0145_10300 [Raineyella sp. W15-4]
MTTSHTRDDATRYVTTALGDYAYQYDLQAITDDLHDQAGHWNMALLDDETCTIDFWAVCRAHELPISTAAVPACPAWCTLNRGHEYEIEEPDGRVSGVHEGQIAAVDSGAGSITLTMVQRVLRHPDQTVTIDPAYVTVTGPEGGADFTNPHTLAALGDAIRTAAHRLEQLG